MPQQIQKTSIPKGEYYYMLRLLFWDSRSTRITRSTHSTRSTRSTCSTCSTRITPQRQSHHFSQVMRLARR